MSVLTSSCFVPSRVTDLQIDLKFTFWDSFLRHNVLTSSCFVPSRVTDLQIDLKFTFWDIFLRHNFLPICFQCSFVELS